MRTVHLLPLALLLPTSAAAQLARPGSPASLHHAIADEVPAELVPAPDLERLRAEDEQRGPFPYRYGAVIPFPVGLETHGRWDEVEATGELVWRLEVASPGAYSIGLLFERFRIPEGGEVFVHDPEYGTVLGAFTRANEQPNGMLQIQPLPGDRAVIEYVHPAGSGELPELLIGQVIHDYRDILDRLGDGPGVGGNEDAICYIDINCPQGAPYQDIKRAVVEVFSGGGQCSAGLLNNTAEDGRPYFLVADHCGDMTNVVAIFNYERTGCGSGSSSQSQSISGAVLRDRSPVYDSQLYEFNNAPPDAYQPFYAGWGRSPTPGKGAVGIHHAQGQPKKISIDDQRPQDGGQMWRVQWDDGQVHGGSSGSPLFNDRKRVIGPACCVTNFNCGTQVTMYGRFDKFWTQDNLEQWLDPLNTGRIGLDGYDPVNPQAIPYYGSRKNPEVYTSTLPAIGGNWTATVDVSGEPGATATYLVGYAASVPAGMNFGFGELLVDLTSQRFFQRTQAASGGQSVFSFAIPNLGSLDGVVAYTQAFILSPSGSRATNAVKLRLR